MATLVDRLRNYLEAEELVRAPDVAGVGARPWLPPAYRHPDGGAIGPGDARDREQPETAWDDGLVLSIMIAPGVPPTAGNEERRILGVEYVYRSRAVPQVIDLDNEIRALMLDRANGYPPGGRLDWILDGLHIIQTLPWRELAPIGPSVAGTYTFSSSYLFEIHAT